MIARWVVLVVSCLGLCVPGGCVSAGGGGERPGSASPPSDDGRGAAGKVEYDKETPGRLLVMIPGREAIDSNLNGAADMVPLDLLLFATDNSKESPLWVPGRLEIVMRTLEGEREIRRWELSEEQVDAARAMSQFGRKYRIAVTVLSDEEQGADKVRPTWVRVRCRFTPSGAGEPLTGTSPSVQIGEGA